MERIPVGGTEGEEMGIGDLCAEIRKQFYSFNFY